MEHGFVLLGGDTVAPSGLYARLCHAFLVSTFFNMSKAISVSAGPIFTIFSPNGRYLREFFSPLGKLAEGLSILLALISSSFFTMSKAISVSTAPIFTIFLPNGRYLHEFS